MRTPIARSVSEPRPQAQKPSKLRVDPYTSTRRYNIKNIQSGYILVETDDLAWAKRMWRKIPRRKFAELILLDNETGEILKTKPPKGVEETN